MTNKKRTGVAPTNPSASGLIRRPAIGRRLVLRTRNPGVVITDPELLASLRLSEEAIARIERLERISRRPVDRILIGHHARHEASS